MNPITKKILSIALLMLLVIGAAADDEVEIDPDADVNVTINAPEYVSEDTFEVTMDVTEVTDFDSGQFDLMFDPDVINVVDVTDGNIEDIKISVDMWRHMDDDRVRVIFNADAGAEGVSGYGYVAKIAFEVVGDIGDTSAIDMSDEFERGLYYLEPREGYDTVGPADLPANWFGTTVTIGTAPAVSDEIPTPAPAETPAVNATPDLESTSAPTPTETPIETSLELSSNPLGMTARAESAPAAAVPGASSESSEDGGLPDIPAACDLIPIYSLVGLLALIYALTQFK